MGYGRQGVILDAVGRAISSGRRRPGRMAITCCSGAKKSLNWRGSPAYFRVFHVFGSVWCCWWNCHTDGYRQVTPEEEHRHGLGYWVTWCGGWRN
jgi:hypothetical protein